MEKTDAVLTGMNTPHTPSIAKRPTLMRVLDHLPWVILASIALAVGLLCLVSPAFREFWQSTWAVLTSGDQQRIREHIQGYGARGPVASVVMMTLQVIVAPIPASVVQLSNGVVYGMVGGTLLNIVGQMCGATAAFFIARSLGRGPAERLAGKVDEEGVFERWLDRWGARALLVIRAIPGMPSDFVSYLCGLTTMPVRRYLLVSLVGYIPQSFAYAWLGNSAMQWFWWIMAGGFVISGIIALVVWLKRSRTS